MRTSLKVGLAGTLWLALLAPLWLKTILVHRAFLNADLLQHYERLAAAPVAARIPVAVSGAEFPDIAAACQYVLDERLDALGAPRRFAVRETCDAAAELCVHVKLGTNDALGLNSSSSRLEVEVSPRTMLNGAAPHSVALLLLEHVYKDELGLPAQQQEQERDMHDEVTVRYSPRYHVTFSLLGESNAILGWDVQAALATHLGAFTAYINEHVAELTIDTQIGSYAAPGCERTEWLAPAQLSRFVDFAEWSLASSAPYPTLNFVLYVPSTPLHIARDGSGDGSGGASSDDANAFLVPQWGGVYIAEPSDGHVFSVEELGPVLQRFGVQLVALLGMREPGGDEPSKASPAVRLAKLARAEALRGVRAAAASLGSLRRLAGGMPQIAIPEAVAARSREAMREIDAAVALLAAGEPGAGRHAARAYECADRAFFDKHMVAQAFFPDEQKLAVYMPLIGPLVIVVVSCWWRFLKTKPAKAATETKAEPKAVPELVAPKAS